MWYPFDAAASAQLEYSHRGDYVVVQSGPEGFHYRVDFKTMQQTNISHPNHTVRAVAPSFEAAFAAHTTTTSIANHTFTETCAAHCEEVKRAPDSAAKIAAAKKLFSFIAQHREFVLKSRSFDASIRAKLTEFSTHSSPDAQQLVHDAVRAIYGCAVPLPPPLSA